MPPKSAQVYFLWGKNDVRAAIQQFYTPKNIPPKQISGYAPGAMSTGDGYGYRHGRNDVFYDTIQEAQLLLGDRATRKHAKDC